MTPARSHFGMTALVPAAGSGERFGGTRPKQFLEVGGRSLLAWTLDRLRAAGLDRFVVAVPRDLLDVAAQLLGPAPDLELVAGGATRQESVEACLRAASGGSDELILVHDGARPLVAAEDVWTTLEAAASADGAVLGRPVSDTMKRVEGPAIVATVERTGHFRAETPQIFRRRVLEEAFAAARSTGFAGTDESSLVERLPGRRIVAVTASRPNPKLTDPTDSALIEALLRLELEPEGVSC